MRWRSSVAHEMTGGAGEYYWGGGRYFWVDPKGELVVFMAALPRACARAKLLPALVLQAIAD